MIHFNLHLSGPRIRTLIAIANNEASMLGGLVISRMQRDGLLRLKTVPGRVEGTSYGKPEITDRGRIVLDLVREDVEEFLPLKPRIKR